MNLRKKTKDSHPSLFNLDEFHLTEREWQGMPEFNHQDLTPFQSVIMHFETREDRNKFSKLINQTITHKTKSLWYPKLKIEKFIDKRYNDES